MGKSWKITLLLITGFEYAIILLFQCAFSTYEEVNIACDALKVSNRGLHVYTYFIVLKRPGSQFARCFALKC